MERIRGFCNWIIFIEILTLATFLILFFLEWCEDYERSSKCDGDKLQNEINKYMEDFDRKQQEV